jgi:hypothetical protein
MKSKSEGEDLTKASKYFVMKVISSKEEEKESTCFMDSLLTFLLDWYMDFLLWELKRFEFTKQESKMFC